MTDCIDFATPAGLRVRGTVLVVPGRGESAGSYRRFGSRLAADAYRVRIRTVETDYAKAGPTADFTAALSAAVADLGEDVVRPLVWIGTDASAAALGALVAGAVVSGAVVSGAVVSGAEADQPWWPDALVLGALPAYGPHDIGDDWAAELAVRTHCPVQRGVLTDDASLERGGLAGSVSDELLDQAYGSTSPLPHLLLVGDRDPIVDAEALARLAKALPTARLSVIRGAHHDVLNDLQHRSVAAEVVSFLEVLREGGPLQAIVGTASSAW